MRVAVLLGLLVFAVPLAALGLSARPEPAPSPAWPTSPPDRPAPAVGAARWNASDRESLSKLRRITLAQTRRVLGPLEECETRAERRTDAARNRFYRRCATPLLAWTNGFASANGRMLSNLAGTAGPTDACRGRVLQLSGASANLAFTAITTVRGGLDLPWTELLAASRTIRAFAQETRTLAREPGWGETCKPRPPAAERSGDGRVA